MAAINLKNTPKAPALAGTLFGLAVAVALAVTARWLKLQFYPIADIGLGIPGKALEYPLWAAALGLLANYALKAAGLHEWSRAGFRTELFLKVGLCCWAPRSASRPSCPPLPGRSSRR
ncbi:MAG: hypothetical protein ACKOC5_19815 [Chloroflexota bacterium]